MADRSPGRMPFDQRAFRTMLLTTAAGVLCMIGAFALRVLMPGSTPLSYGLMAVALLLFASEIVRSVPGYAADEAWFARPARSGPGVAEHQVRHSGEYQDHRRLRPGWWGRMARYRRCASGFGHCMHPRTGDAYWARTEQREGPDGALEQFDAGAWCCECPATWLWTPIPVWPCRVCDAAVR